MQNHFVDTLLRRLVLSRVDWATALGLLTSFFHFSLLKQHQLSNVTHKLGGAFDHSLIPQSELRIPNFPTRFPTIFSGEPFGKYFPKGSPVVGTGLPACRVYFGSNVLLDAHASISIHTSLGAPKIEILFLRCMSDKYK